jgi:hypothetical protein
MAKIPIYLLQVSQAKVQVIQIRHSVYEKGLFETLTRALACLVLVLSNTLSRIAYRVAFPQIMPILARRQVKEPPNSYSGVPVASFFVFAGQVNKMRHLAVG